MRARASVRPIIDCKWLLRVVPRYMSRSGRVVRHWSCLRHASLCTCFPAVRHPVIMVSLLHNFALVSARLPWGS